MLKYKSIKVLLLITFIHIPFFLKASETKFEKRKPMFAVIYRGYVKPHLEVQYQQYWRKIAAYFVNERGAIGSTLHKTDDGLWIAYSKWPDQETRDASWPKNNSDTHLEISEDIQEAIIGLKECLDTERQFPEICMEIIDEISIEKINLKK